MAENKQSRKGQLFSGLFSRLRVSELGQFQETKSAREHHDFCMALGLSYYPEVTSSTHSGPFCQELQLKHASLLLQGSVSTILYLGHFSQAKIWVFMSRGIFISCLTQGEKTVHLSQSHLNICGGTKLLREVQRSYYLIQHLLIHCLHALLHCFFRALTIPDRHLRSSCPLFPSADFQLQKGRNGILGDGQPSKQPGTYGSHPIFVVMRTTVSSFVL